MKKLLLTIGMISGLLFLTQGVSAADYSTSCTAISCSPSTITGFFPSSEVWYPGKIYTKSIEISNSSGDPQQVTVDALNIYKSDPIDDISQVIQYTITRDSDGATVWSNSLYAFYNQGGVNLRNLLGNGLTDTFHFTGEMYLTAGNAYQDQQTQYDLVFTITTNVTPTPTPVCTQTVPNTPGSITVSKVNDSEVKVVWGAAGGTLTGYRVSWSKNPDFDGDGEGTRSVGNTTETNVGGLNLSTDGYYFKVRAVNNCAEGNPTGIEFIGSGTNLRAISSSTSSPASILGVFTPISAGEIQGLNELTGTPTPSPSSSPSSSSSTTGTVEGVSTSPCNPIWWQILLGSGLLAFVYYFGLIKEMESKQTKIAGGLIAILSFVLFRYVNRCLTYSFFIFANTPSIFCRYFILLDTLLIVTIMILRMKQLQQSKSS